MPRKPIHGCLRIASAAVGSLILYLGCWSIFWSSDRGHVGLGIFFIGWGAFMWFPVFARPASSRAVAAENAHRFRLALITLFLLSLLAYGLAFLGARGDLPVRYNQLAAQRFGLLGASLWLVMFLLLFVSAYYDSQLKQLDEDEKADDEQDDD